MKKIVFIFIITSILGCSSDSEPENPLENLPYYSFTIEDSSRLLIDFNIENVITFKNQDEETIVFEVKDYSRKRGRYSTGSFVGNSSTDYYWYDQQHLTLSLVDLPYLSNQIEILHERRPINFDPNMFPHVKKPSNFNSFLNFPFWNGYRGEDVYDKSIVLDFNLPEISMTFNNRTFENVRIIESGKTEIISPQLTYPRNVHILYYDTVFGIVGFDDLEGNSWRID